MSQLLIDIEALFEKGMRSDASPANLLPGQYWHAVNMVNRGGLLMTRPGYRCKATLPSGKLQGFTVFRPKGGLEQAIFIIDGKVYVSTWPFTSLRMLDNVLLSADAQQVYFCQGEQTVRRLDDTLESGSEFIEPRSVLFIQDGARTAPAWYDGAQSGHDRDNEFGVEIGGPMWWVGERLWVANGPLVYASDIGNPFSFREQWYLGNKSAAAIFKDNVVAMTSIPSVEYSNLLVLTETTTNLVQAGIRTRANWVTTDDFQQELFKVGCSSQRSVVSHNGLLWWWAPSGLTNFDAAAASKKSNRLPPKDLGMTISKVGLSQDLSLVAGAAYGHFLLMSVPHADLFNTHTWVMDNTSVETENDASAPAWNSYWTGTRPVEWFSGNIAGADRVFYVSKDHDGENRLWEAFTSERSDNGCPISWAVETRGFFGPAGNLNIAYPPRRLKQFAFAEIQLGELVGNVDVAVWWAGTARGPYKRCSTKRISAGVGCFRWDQNITETSRIFALKPQSRVVRTQDARHTDAVEGASCGVESPNNENIDESFQLLIAGSGQAAILGIRAFAQPEEEDVSGSCEENEAGQNLVRFDGSAVTDATYADALAALVESMTVFEGSATATLDHGKYSAVGTGYARSIVSQDDANKIAAVIAEQEAQAALQKAIPPIISDGKHYSNDGI